MLAVGSLSDPSLLPRLEAILSPSGDVRVDETDTVAVAAAWGVARMRSPRAHPLLVRLLSSDSPSVRALSAIGLGLLHDRGDAKRLAAMASSLDQEPMVRAAAAFALGALGDGSASDVLSRLTEASDPLLRGTAVIALSRLRAAPAKRAIAAALVAPDPSLRKAAAEGALVFATHDYRGTAEPVAMPEGRVDVREVLATLAPSGYSADERARAVVDVSAELSGSAAGAVHSGPEGARVVADALLAGGGRPAFAPLTDGIEGASAEARSAAETALDHVAASLVEAFVALAHHPSPDVRARTIALLATRAEEPAREAIVAALADPEPDVQRAALAALSTGHDQRGLSAVIELSERASAWAVRARATEALGSLMSGADDGAALAVLVRVAEHDDVGFVRESAVRALMRSKSAAARDALGRVAKGDPEPRVRALAAAELAGHDKQGEQTAPRAEEVPSTRGENDLR
jgi:HEAT repeat protein